MDENQNITAKTEEAENTAAKAEGVEKEPLLQMREEVKKKFWTPERIKDAKEWVVSLVVALVIVFIIRTFLFTIIRVDGLSMHPTLDNDERLFVTILDVKLNGVERGDVVICNYPNRGTWWNKTKFVKRVVGVAGDVIKFEDGATYVNGELVDESYITHKSNQDGEYTVPEGCVFVCGDNRANSHDSRSSDVGYLDESMIVGKVRYVIYPFKSIRAVE